MDVTEASIFLLQIVTLIGRRKVMALQDEIESCSSTIHTDGYAMSFGELLNMYESNEVDIHPEFQRFFRWDIDQKSRLIESILLGIPLPSIFVSQREDGVWDVIDGLQRLSTIFQLAGVLRDEDKRLVDPLVLTKTKYLPSLHNKTWDGSVEGTNALTMPQRLYIKRSKIDVKIIKKESDSNSKYELFQRLNTGGSTLSDQEVRNCAMISVDREAYMWVKELASRESFVDATSLSDKAKEEQFDLDLVVRFMVFAGETQGQLRKIGDVGEYLTDAVVEMVTNKTFINQNKQGAFEFVFDKLSRVLGQSAFHRYRESDDRFVGGFLLSAFEALAVGIGSLKLEDTAYDIDDESLVGRVKELWQDEVYLKGIGSGVRASQRIPVTVPKGAEWFGK